MTGPSRTGATPEPNDIESFIDATGVSRETALCFEVWRALLEKWSARINLVGASTREAFWSRHALDSIQVVDVAPKPDDTFHVQRWADLGSGAGFPGLAAAIALDGAGRRVEVHLVESNAKKAAFLREAVRVTGAPAVVRAVRIEELAKKPRHVKPGSRGADPWAGGPRPEGAGAGERSEAQDAMGAGAGECFDVITARACAPLTRLLGHAHCLWKETSVGVFLKGREAELELTAASKSWRFQSELQPSRSDPNGWVVLIERLEHVHHD